MKVLVTGAHGFIGRWVWKALEAAGHEPSAFDCVDADGRATGHNVLDREQITAAVKQADAVIHLAGILGTEETIGVEHASVEVNILGMLNVLDAAGDRPVVLAGTGHKGQLNPYAITKGAAEDLALSRVEWTGASVAIVRAFHVYGPGQEPPAPHGTATVRKFFPSFACRALTNMPVQIWGSGQQRIDPVWVADVAQILVDALDGPSGQVIDAGAGVGLTVREIAQTIVDVTGSESEIQHLPMRAGEPLVSTVVAAIDRVAVAPDGGGVCHVWPYRIDEALDYYRDLLAGKRA